MISRHVSEATFADDFTILRDTLSDAISPSERQALCETYFPQMSTGVPPSTFVQRLPGAADWESSVVQQPTAVVPSSEDDFMSWDGVAREAWGQFPRC